MNKIEEFVGMITTIWAKTGMHSTTEFTFEGPGWHCFMKVFADGTRQQPVCSGSPAEMYPLTVTVYDTTFKRRSQITFTNECDGCRYPEPKSEVYAN